MATDSDRRCGARRRHDMTKRCRMWARKGRTRCRHHGGNWVPSFHKRNTVPMRQAVALKQQMLRSWGIRWKDACRPVTAKEAIGIMEDAVERTDLVISTLPPLVESDRPDAEKSAGELLNEGLHVGLILGRDVCRAAAKHLEKIEAAGIMLYGEDLKVLRLGTDTAGWLVRAGVRVVEGEFRGRRDDVLGKLLAQIAEARAAGAKP
jgi:hypothetical protein